MISVIKIDSITQRRNAKKNKRPKYRVGNWEYGLSYPDGCQTIQSFSKR